MIQEWLKTYGHLVDHKNGLLFRRDGAIRVPKMDRGYRYHKIKMGGKVRTVAEHQLVWVKVNGIIPIGFSVDHINRVSTDNRIENLRLATHSEQQFNSIQNKISKDHYSVVMDQSKSLEELAKLFNTTKGYVANLRYRLKKRNSYDNAGYHK